MGYGLNDQRRALGNGLSGLNLREQLTRRFAGTSLGLSATGLGINTNPLAAARQRAAAIEGRMRREGDEAGPVVHHVHHHLYGPMPPDENHPGGDNDGAEPENENIAEARRRSR